MTDGRNSRKVWLIHSVRERFMVYLPKPGTYTFPIGFAIPGNSPPSLSCAFGSVSWYLKAEAHRPGTFTTKLQSRRDVILIACPEDIDDAESIIVERIWDTQLQYMISVSGKSFYIGGTIPIQFKLMPLTKMKIYQIAVWLEGKYYHFGLWDLRGSGV